MRRRQRPAVREHHAELADTDGDGIGDASDPEPAFGDPGGATSMQSLARIQEAGEPQVAVGSNVAILTDATRSVSIEVSNAGAGTVEWSASSGNEAIALATPRSPDVRTSGQLTITAAPSYDFRSNGFNKTTVRVFDVGGRTADVRTIDVLVYGVLSNELCGHAVNDSVLASVTATDALVALRAAVGSFPCEICRCDLDDSGTVSATDALRILKAAVGTLVSFDCPACDFSVE